MVYFNDRRRGFVGCGLIALFACVSCINKTGDTNIGVSGRCGDGSLDRAEDCDDDNDESGDGCSDECVIEPGWTCSRPGRACTEDASETDDATGDDTSDDSAGDDTSDNASDDARGDDEPSDSDDDELSSSEDDTDEEATTSTEDEPDETEPDDATETIDETDETDETTDDTDAPTEPDEPADECVLGEDTGVVAEAWVRQFGNTEPTYVTTVAVDGCGNVIVAGTAYALLPEQTLDFESGPTAFVRKYDANGEELWTDQFATGTWTIADSVGVDADGNVFVAGETKGALGEQQNAGEVDAFIRKYDANGEPQWLQQFGSDGWDSITGLALNSDGSPVVTGHTTGVFPDKLGDGIYKDAFVAKFTPAGAAVWTEQFGSSGEDYAHAVAVDSAGNVFVVGRTYDTLTSEPNAGSYELFARALDAEGDELWTTQLAGTGDDTAMSVAVASDGSVYIGGYTDGELADTPSEGEYDALLIKLDAEGETVWIKQFGTNTADDVTALAVDADGDIIVVGGTDGALPGQTWGGQTDLFVRGYDADGYDLWTGQFGELSADHGYALALDASGKPVIGGSTSSALGGVEAVGMPGAFVMVLDP